MRHPGFCTSCATDDLPREGTGSAVGGHDELSEANGGCLHGLSGSPLPRGKLLAGGSPADNELLRMIFEKVSCLEEQQKKWHERMMTLLTDGGVAPGAGPFPQLHKVAHVAVSEHVHITPPSTALSATRCAPISEPPAAVPVPALQTVDLDEPPALKTVALDEPRPIPPVIDANSSMRTRPGGESSRGSEATATTQGSVARRNTPTPSFAPSSIFPPALPFDGVEREEPPVEIPPLRDGLGPFVRAVCHRCIHWWCFDYLIGFVIFVNSILIGYEAAEEVHGRTYGFIGYIEPLFLGIYILELIMRLFADGLRWNLAQPWVRFDIFLVGLGTLSMVVIEPLKAVMRDAESQQSEDENVAMSALEWVLIFRIARLLRLLRALRLLSQFETLWRLVRGLLNSGRVMCSTMALLFFVIYVFACVGVEIITKEADFIEHEDQVIRDIRETSFRTLPGVMLTLSQFVTLDSVAGIYTPLIEDKWYMIFYFLPIILIVPIALMNLVTAVLVEAAMAMAEDDEEMAKKRRRAYLRELTPDIHEAFKIVDEDDSGVITKEEVMNAQASLPPVLMQTIRGGEFIDFFDTLDMDGSGEVSEAEFVEGVLHFIMSDVPVETQQSLKLLRIVKEKLTLLEEVVFQLPGAPPQKSAHAFHKHDKASIVMKISAGQVV